MASITFMKQRLEILQQDFEKASVRQQEDFPGEVYMMGRQAFGACHSEEDVKACCDQLSDDGLRAAFIKGIREQVNAPAYKDTPKAEILRPFVNQCYAELHA